MNNDLTTVESTPNLRINNFESGFGKGKEGATML